MLPFDRIPYREPRHLLFSDYALPRVLRTRLLQDVDSRRGAFGRRFLLRRLRDGLIREAGGLQRARLALGGGIAVPLPNPVLATAPRIPLSPPVPLPYPGPPGKAGEPRRLTFVALFGSPLPAIPLDRRSRPVCTLFTGATTVAGAALPVPRLRPHIFFRPLRLARWRIDFHLLENRIEFHGFRNPTSLLWVVRLLREKNVRLFGVQLHRFRLYRLWFRGRNFGFTFGGALAAVAQPGFP